jgi:hypothetical protein
MELKKYILVQWPYSQIFMDHPRFNECYLLQASDNQQHYDAAYFIPEDLYEELKSKTDN